MRICVYCGSSAGKKPLYRKAAQELGYLLAREKIGLVFGGGSVGLMGAVADAVVEKGGEVIGVIPEALARLEVAHEGVSKLHVVQDMHERKALMASLSDGFVAMPGGIGTMEELFEVWTWLQLGMQDKPCALYNVGGFFDKLTSFLDWITEQGFLKQEHRKLLFESDDPEAIIHSIRAYEPRGDDGARRKLGI